MWWIRADDLLCFLSGIMENWVNSHVKVMEKSWNFITQISVWTLWDNMWMFCATYFLTRSINAFCFQVCFEAFSTANILSIHWKVSHDTAQTASADDLSRRKTIDVHDDESKLCDVQRGLVHRITGSSLVDGNTDEQGDNTQQQGSSSSSNSSSGGGSQRNSDLTRNTSLPSFRSANWCDDAGSSPPDDNIIEYPSMFPGLKHRLSIKNETVLVTRLDGVDMKAGAQMSLFKCHMCGRMFRLLSRLQCHLSMHFERQLLLFQCSLCDQQFQFKMQLLQHLRSHGVRNVNINTNSPHTATTASQGLLSTVSPAFSSGSVNDAHPAVQSPSDVTDVTETPRATSDLQVFDYYYFNHNL